MISLALLTSCGEHGERDATSDPHTLDGLETTLTIREALSERHESSTDILLEASIASIPAVGDRVRQLKEELDDSRADNSICVAGKRGSIGKTAFICNDNNYDLLILARPAGQSISSNLRYIEEFADDPLHSGLVEAIQIVSAQLIDTAEADCVRLVFTDSAGEARKDVPIIVMVRTGDQASPMPVEEDDLTGCLE